MHTSAGGFAASIQSDPELLRLLEKSLAAAAAINPDPLTNPCQTIEALVAFIDRSMKCLPWDLLPDGAYCSLYDRIDQGICYMWFLFDQPLDELKDRGYFYPSLQYHHPISEWLEEYVRSYGKWLSEPESWSPEMMMLAQSEPSFGLINGWYEAPENWKCFNDFFSRRLSSPEVRPIDDADIVMPADSVPQGIWNIDSNSMISDEGSIIKSKRFKSVPELLGPRSAYAHAFDNGTLMHVFLNVHDYHRYHSPVSGKIAEISDIPGMTCAGGVTVWDAESGRYILGNDTGFQMIEQRACVIIETPEWGPVGMLPVGMSQICSCNWEPSVRTGAQIEKGDPLGWFLFGGSDIVILLPDKAHIDRIAETGVHKLMGEAFISLG